MIDFQPPEFLQNIATQFSSRFLARSAEQNISQVDYAKGLLNSTRLTEVASYWSGLPANREYYDESDLHKIYDRLKNDRGNRSAFAFANMVIDMPSLAPSNVVRAVLSLAENDWIYDSRFSEEILQGNTDIRPVRPDLAAGMHDQMAEKIGGFAQGVMKADETIEIRELFRENLKSDMEGITAARQIIDA